MLIILGWYSLILLSLAILTNIADDGKPRSPSKLRKPAQRVITILIIVPVLIYVILTLF